MGLIRHLTKTLEELEMDGAPHKSLEQQQREGIDAGLASGVNRDYWEQQQRKLEEGK